MKDPLHETPTYWINHRGSIQTRVVESGKPDKDAIASSSEICIYLIRSNRVWIPLDQFEIEFKGK